MAVYLHKPTCEKNEFITYPPEQLGQTLQDLITQGTFKPGETFLDLGAGKGDLIAEAKKAGLHSYGIEIDQKLTRQGRRNGITTLATGSYYTPEYIRFRSTGKSIAHSYELGRFKTNLGDMQYVGKAEEFLPDNSEIFRLERRGKPFSQLGIAFEQVNVFFAYTWGPEFPSLLEMFSMQANQKALFLSHNSHDPEFHFDLMRDLHLHRDAIELSDGSIPRLGYTRLHIYTKGEPDIRDLWATSCTKKKLWEYSSS